ncbi:MAG: M3 family metallopeptidase [Candidatus Gracilibacteria bacterium]|nr:M3 family metallopeptidase [Candidatus Gracilibacteria bacterium]
MNLKERVISELKNKNFPDLKFLMSDEVLDLATEILNEELENDKTRFEDFLKKENSSLTFDSFEDESILDYFWILLNHFENVETSEKLRNIIEDFRPKIQDFSNEVAYNKPYFEKLIYVAENLKLDVEQRRIMDLRIKSYKDRGIDLPFEQQEEIKKINKKLGELSDKFTNNIVDYEKTFEYLITDFELIKDLPLEVLEIAKEAGKEKGGYLFDSDPTSYSAIMKYCSSQEIRAFFEKASYSTASNGKFDNREIVLELLRLKDKKAKILGYKNYAELSLNDKMADSPEQVFELLNSISEKAKKKAELDIQELKDYFSLENIETYDLGYYSRILKEKKYDLDEKELKKYFEFEDVLNYLHRFVENFYSIEIKETKIESYNKDVRVYEIYKDNNLISYYFLDAFYRKGKRPGAWADNLREKMYFPETSIPVILNVCNFQKANSGKITLYLRDVETIFHEFGHALHEMLSESKYSELSGFGVEWDFVELPSQLLENWVSDKDSLKKLSKHIETGENFSDEIIEKLEKLKTFMTGVFVARQNEFALLDMSLYSSEIPNNVEELDKKILEIVNKYSIFKRGDDYKMYCSFNHIFGGGYAAGYYSYTWAEIIEADIFSRIKEMGMFDKKTGESFLKTILGQGTRKKASELFFDFMGREVENEAYIKRYGLI